MANITVTIPLNLLSKRLVGEGLLSNNQAIAAQHTAKQQNQNFIHYLHSIPFINSDLLAYFIAEEFGLPYLDLDTFDDRYLPKKIVNEQLLHQHQALPLYKKGNLLSLALSSPTNLIAIDEIQFQTGLIIQPIIVAQEKLSAKLNALLATATDAFDELETIEEEAIQLDANLTTKESLTTKNSKYDAPIIKFVNKILINAVNQGASDIHFEPFEHSYRIRIRVDGVLHEVTRPPLSLHSRLAACIKVMAQMDIAERRLPQDGSITLKAAKARSLDFRVNSLPTLWGEKIVLRILDSNSAKLGIEELGFEPEQQALYTEALANPQGLILVTGPTGSGKTVSLYTGLTILNTPERNISSVEDPVEIHLEGINQVNVNTKVGLNFASVLRAFLRQDPDVLMVGEIRDFETAEIAIKAAQTGHLVLSTLHTNSAVASISRLFNMGIPAYNLANSLQLIIAQRLVRKLCPQCKMVDTRPKQALLQLGFTQQELAQATFFKAVGCQQCTRGYKGRTGIYEVVKITPELSDLMLTHTHTAQLEAKARELGFASLSMAGRKKVLKGLLSLDELTRITMEKVN